VRCFDSCCRARDPPSLSSYTCVQCVSQGHWLWYNIGTGEVEWVDELAI
jgi:hypothetical protein